MTLTEEKAKTATTVRSLDTNKLLLFELTQLPNWEQIFHTRHNANNFIVDFASRMRTPTFFALLNGIFTDYKSLISIESDYDPQDARRAPREDDRSATLLFKGSNTDFLSDQPSSYINQALSIVYHPNFMQVEMPINYESNLGEDLATNMRIIQYRRPKNNGHGSVEVGTPHVIDPSRKDGTSLASLDRAKFLRFTLPFEDNSGDYVYSDYFLYVPFAKMGSQKSIAGGLVQVPRIPYLPQNEGGSVGNNRGAICVYPIGGSGELALFKNNPNQTFFYGADANEEFGVLEALKTEFANSVIQSN